MVVLAKGHRTTEVCGKRFSAPKKRESMSTARLAITLHDESSSTLSSRGELAADSRRTLALSLTLTQWTPMKYQDSYRHTFGPLGDVLTARISGPRSRVMTSAPGASPLYPLTMAAPSPWDESLASTQHATDRFPRFTYLLRTGTPKPEADGGLVRRSADPGEHQASLATIPDPPAQCGTGDETCLQSCVASDSDSTCGPSSRASSSPSRASTPTTPAGTLASVSTSASAFASKPLFDPTPYTMANDSATTSRSGASTPRLPVPTRRGTDAIAGERIMPGTPLSTSPTSQTSSDFGDAGADDDLEQDDAQGGSQTTEGQPRKKKTRRAGVAITRVRRMQREVRRLAEEEEQAIPSSQQRQQPQRSLLSGIQARPSLSPSLSAPPPLPPLHIPQYGHGQQQQMRALTSPSTLSATRPPAAEARHARSEPSPTAHSRASAYDRTLEDGDDVVVWRPSGPMGSSSIWAYRPDERPRGGPA